MWMVMYFPLVKEEGFKYINIISSILINFEWSAELLYEESLKIQTSLNDVI